MIIVFVNLQYWKRLRAEARFENALHQKSVKNKLPELYKISELSCRVLKIMGTKHGNGLSLIPEAGVSKLKKALINDSVSAVFKTAISSSTRAG